MADSTIANLSSGSPAVSTDQLPIQRGSSTLKLTVGDINPTQTLTFTITPTMIKAFSGAAATDAIVIANPGAGLMIVVDDVIGNIQFATTPYATGTGDLAFFYSTGAAHSGTTSVAAQFDTTFIKSSSSQVARTGAITPTAGSVSGQANRAFTVNQNAATLYTAGNSSIVLTIRYRIISAS